MKNKDDVEELIELLCPDLNRQIDAAYEHFYSLPEDEKKKILKREIKYNRILQRKGEDEGAAGIEAIEVNIDKII